MLPPLLTKLTKLLFILYICYPPLLTKLTKTYYTSRTL
ncbi:hypothetical protein BMETH_2141_0 [methanotrophic bacterial endosymbiont of Bathymodiolus sp.]|nr:hypothetical protein BMETH_2141_0 [methanotrophic bacterial endosymbiont of Bathymodiolus sp.]